MSIRLSLDYASVLQPASDHILVENIPAYAPAYARMI